MFSRNGTIDYNFEVHTLDPHKASAARQESTTKNSQFCIVSYRIVMNNWGVTTQITRGFLNFFGS